MESTITRMDAAVKILEYLRSKGAEVTVSQEGNLDYEAPIGLIDKVMRQQLVTFKPEIKIIIENKGKVKKSQEPEPVEAEEAEMTENTETEHEELNEINETADIEDIKEPGELRRDGMFCWHVKDDGSYCTMRAAKISGFCSAHDTTNFQLCKGRRASGSICGARAPYGEIYCRACKERMINNSSSTGRVMAKRELNSEKLSRFPLSVIRMKLRGVEVKGLSGSEIHKFLKENRTYHNWMRKMIAKGALRLDRDYTHSRVDGFLFTMSGARTMLSRAMKSHYLPQTEMAIRLNIALTDYVQSTAGSVGIPTEDRQPKEPEPQPRQARQEALAKVTISHTGKSSFTPIQPANQHDNSEAIRQLSSQMAVLASEVGGMKTAMLMQLEKQENTNVLLGKLLDVVKKVWE